MPTDQGKLGSTADWLKALGLDKYVELFAEQEIDLDLLPELTEEDLEKLGIPFGPRKRLLKAIAALGSAEAPALAPTSEAIRVRLGPAAAPTPEGERRQATVLFSDLSGYTAMNERLDPEVVAELVGHIKAEAVGIVEAHGGIVNQFVGDEILALFGIPIAHEDDPVRAVRAALALHRMVKDMASAVAARIGQPLRLHTGIDTGLVVTSLRDQRDGTFGLTGDAVNTGARIAAQATADEVLVSPQTYQRIADYFETEALSAARLKGKADPLTPYRILRPTKAETRFEAAQRRGLTGYTGRAGELASLLACAQRTYAGDGQFVAVIGDAGSGKSRLLFEFRNSLERNNVGVVEGRCQSYGTETPYLPFLDALRRALDLRRDDSPDQLLDKAITNARAIDAALERFLPHYLHLLSIPSEQYPMSSQLQGAERKRAFEEALAAIFTLAARRRPLVVVLEDWHWADATSDAVLRRLVGLVDQYALMIVMLCRPEYDLSWAAPVQFTRIVLTPLSISETGSMARTALKVVSMPDALQTLLHERTGGNPLFIEEVCRTLLDERILTVSEGRATLARRIETVQLPDTVQAVIRARVDRLEQSAQEVLRLASVIGREFARTLLERIATRKDALGSTLEALNAEDLIRQVRVLPEPEYMFKHVLTQLVVYETLLLVRRQRLHELIGAAIEELYADRLEEHYEALAFHYQHSDNREKAIRYLELSGDKAKAQYVVHQILKNYQQAISLLEGLEKTPDRMRQYIDISVKWADLVVPSTEIIQALQVSQSHAEGLNDIDRLAKVTSFLGQMLVFVGSFDRAIPQLQRVIAMGDALEDQNPVGSSYRVLGWVYLWTSRREEGLECLEEAITIHRRTGNGVAESFCLALIATEYGLLGRFKDSLPLFENAIRIVRECGARSVEAWERGLYRVQVPLARGDWHAAIATCDEAIELSERIEDAWPGTWAAIGKGYATFMSGDQDGGLAFMQQAVRKVETLGVMLAIAGAYGWLAEMLCLAGRPDEAAALADKALAHLHLGSACAAESRAYRVRAMAGATRSPIDWESVSSDMEKSLSNARTLGYRPDLAVSHFRYAELLHANGSFEQARQQLDQGAQLFIEMDMPWWIEQTAKLRSELGPA